MFKRCFAAAIFFLLASHGEAKLLVSVSDIAEQSILGVVNIRTTSYIPKADPALDLYKFFLDGRIPTATSTHAVGSGVIIDKKGHILTNVHVIEGASVIEILFAKSKQKVRGKIIGTDPKTDLALLQVDGTLPTLNPLDLGDSDALRIGDAVIAVGNPFGFSHTVTSGIISAKGRVIGTGPYDNFLQTDASIHPGNSGGPLIDLRGRVIGINTAVSKEGQGIGFAIPINTAKDIVRDLLAYGKVRRPWLGMVGKNILSHDDIDTGIDPTGVYGVIVANLVIDGPGYKAGIRIGDLIMTMDDTKLTDLNHFQRLLGSKSPADKIRIKLYRRGKGILHATINLEETPKAEDLPMEKDLF